MCLTATDWPVRLSRARYTIPKEPPERVLLLELFHRRVKAAIDALTSQLLQHVIVVRRHVVGDISFYVRLSPLVLLFRTVRQLLTLALLRAQQ